MLKFNPKAAVFQSVLFKGKSSHIAPVVGLFWGVIAKDRPVHLILLLFQLLANCKSGSRLAQYLQKEHDYENNAG